MSWSRRGIECCVVDVELEDDVVVMISVAWFRQHGMRMSRLAILGGVPKFL